MSLLMFSHYRQETVILTDTLATIDHVPYRYMSKSFIVPHLDLVIAVTGIGNLCGLWHSVINENMLCLNIDMLDRHAPEAIRNIWADLMSDDKLSGQTSTVYHFGISEESGDCVGYAYRSTNDFVSERLPEGGVGIKPQPVGTWEAPDNLPGFIELACRVRKEQDALPISERIDIGGALRVIVIANRTIATSEIYRFDDFEQVWNEMNERQLGGS